jgi:hypothetical protein
VNRIAGTALALLVVVVALPAIAATTEGAVPALASLLALILVAKLASAPRRRQ